MQDRGDDDRKQDWRNGGYGPGYDEGLGSGATEDLLLPPWERRDRFGALNGLYLTIKDVLLTPGRFFHRMPSQVGIGQPLGFAVILGVIAAFFDWLWSLTGSSLLMFLPHQHLPAFTGPLWAFGSLLISPLVALAIVFVKAGLLHGALMLFGGNRLGFEATFRVAAYSEAVSILHVVPACGRVIGIPWMLVVVAVGLYNIHETEPWRAVAAVVALVVVALAATAVMGAAVLLTAGMASFS